MEHIKIITINTWKCDGDYPVRMRILAEQLKVLQPDIIACQECFFNEEGDGDTLKFLADELNMDYSFAPGRSKKRYFEGKWVSSLSGLGILSKYAITNTKEFILPGVPEDDDRKVQQAEITLPAGATVLITNTHLTHLSNPDLRTAQAEMLAGLVSRDENTKYHIICGDFNTTPGSAELSTFMSLSWAIDCYSAGDGAEPRYSFVDAYKSNKHICVDHIFALPKPGADTYPEFVNSGIVLNVADKSTGLYASDHFGISTTLVVH